MSVLLSHLIPHNQVVGCFITCVYIARLVDAFAEEQAIEDAIYYLGEALRKNVIELESFLKVLLVMLSGIFYLRG